LLIFIRFLILTKKLMNLINAYLLYYFLLMTFKIIIENINQIFDFYKQKYFYKRKLR